MVYGFEEKLHDLEPSLCKKKQQRKSLLYAFLGPFGEKEIEEHMRIMKA